MSDTSVGLLLIGVIIAYLPLLYAIPERGGSVWKFVAFILCSAAIGFILFSVGVAVILWLIAWGCAVGARTSARRDAQNGAILAELRKQNELLKAETGRK